MGVNARKILRALTRRILPGALLLFIVVSCIYIGVQYYRYLPHSNTPKLMHSLGMTVYDQSGRTVSPADWRAESYIIASAYETLKTCLGKNALLWDPELRRTTLVILPPRTITLFEQHVVGFTFFKYVFIRRDRLDTTILRHELVHVYLYLSTGSFFKNPVAFGRRFFENFFDLHPLFRQCEFTPEE